MDVLLRFLLTSGDQFSAGGILAAGFALTVTAFYREWIVLGKPYRACMERVAAFESQATDRAAASEKKVAELEAKLAELTERQNRRRP